jgi:hypothetical protein
MHPLTGNSNVAVSGNIMIRKKGTKFVCCNVIPSHFVMAVYVVACLFKRGGGGHVSSYALSQKWAESCFSKPIDSGSEKGNFVLLLCLLHTPPVTKIVWPPRSAMSIFTFTMHHCNGPELRFPCDPHILPTTFVLYWLRHLYTVHEIKYIYTHSLVDHKLIPWAVSWDDTSDSRGTYDITSPSLVTSRMCKWRHTGCQPCLCQDQPCFAEGEEIPECDNRFGEVWSWMIL